MSKNITRAYLRALSGTAALLVPAAASAQQAPPVERLTEVTGSLTVRHDTNVARTDADTAIARNLSRGDDRATPQISLRLARPLGRNSLTLNADAGYDFYRRNKRLNRERLSLAGTGRVAAGPCDLTVAPTFSRRQSDLGEIALIDTPGIGAVRNVETIQDYLGEIRCGNPYGLRPMGTLRRSIGDNSNDIRKISDYRSTQYGGGLSYGNPILGDYSLQFLRNETDYSGRPAGFPGGTGFVTDRFDLRGQRGIGAVLMANASISYIRLRPNESGIGSFNGIGWNIALTALPGPDLSVTGGLSSDVFPSLVNDALYQETKTYFLRGTYRVNRLWSATLGADITDREYVGAGTTFGPALTKSVQRTVSGGLVYAYSQRFGIGFDAGYQKRNANGTIYDFDNVFVALRTTVTL